MPWALLHMDCGNDAREFVDNYAPARTRARHVLKWVRTRWENGHGLSVTFGGDQTTSGGTSKFDAAEMETVCCTSVDCKRTIRDEPLTSYAEALFETIG